MGVYSINHACSKYAQDDFFDWMAHFLEDAAYDYRGRVSVLPSELALATEDCSNKDMEGLV